MRLLTEGLADLAVTSAVVREMDRRAIEEYGMAGAILMENAGAAAAEIACSMLSPGGDAVIAAGAGNNAGDGFVVARFLANRGRNVEIVTAVPPEKYAGDAALNFNIVEQMGLPISLWGRHSPAVFESAALVVDALLGTGLSGPLRPPYAEMIEYLSGLAAPILAIDIPSGLDGDTGRVATAAVTATKTVTFALPKLGLFCGEGRRFAGEVILADIEMPRAVYPTNKVPGKT